MKRPVKLTLLALLLVQLVGCGNPIKTNGEVNILPLPTEVTVENGVFELKRSTPIVLTFEDEELKYVTDEIQSYAQSILGKELSCQNSSAAKAKAINIILDSSLPAEGYNLTVSSSQIDIAASTPQGAFYGVQSLIQLIPAEALTAEEVSSVEIQNCVVKDQPHFGYRGMMMDVCRHFYPVEDVKKTIDVLALHKLNIMHWHLTDDQGWRIEIKKYPRLTEVGSIRKETKIGQHFDDELGYDNTPHGGFYTQEQIKEVVAYAESKFVTIIPEIELPGHGVAALTAYPYLGCTGENYEVRTNWGVSTEIFCAGKETTFEFWEDVLSEVMDLFPSEYIHVGGDECPKTEWEKCPHCQARIKAEKLNNENELQAYVANRIEKFLASKGRKMIGWDEILDADNLSKSAVIMSWRGADGGITAAKRGNHVVMSPNTYCYFDYHQTEDNENEPIAMGKRILTLERVYSFDPYEGLNESERGFINGVQANAWAEFMKDLPHMQYMTLPRLTALSEVAWSYDGRESYDKFLTRVESLLNLYDYHGFNYAKHAFEKDAE